MDLIIRDISESDLDAVLILNQLEARNLNSLDLEQMRWFAANADYFRVAMGSEGLAGYLVGLRPGTTYNSPNYLRLGFERVGTLASDSGDKEVALLVKKL